MSSLVAVILAAGKGTRMKSALPKVLHRLGGKPMIRFVLNAAETAGAKRRIVVAGFKADMVEAELANDAEIVLQHEQLGTGHAVMQTKRALDNFEGTVMVLCGDTPLLTAATLKNLYAQHKAAAAQATVLTAIMTDPTGYGRVIRDADGNVIKIVEQKDASPSELVVNEINTGIYCFEKKNLFDALAEVDCKNKQGEYYLTDVIEKIKQKGGKVGACAAGDWHETLGVNSRIQLSQAEKILRLRKLEELMDNGVTIMDPDSTFIDQEVTVGQDTVLYPFTWLEGTSHIGANCEIGPNCRLTNTLVGDNTTIHFTYAHDCQVGGKVNIGPFVHLRPNTILRDEVKVGNFVEVKNSTVGTGSKLPHLSYIGDTDMGSNVNIGCGTITVNYDGVKKHRTKIGDKAFIGCNSNLVAPVTVNDNAYIAAGSTITRDVPANALGVGRSRQNNIEDWVKKHRS